MPAGESWGLPVNVEGIPRTLRPLRRWVCWAAVHEDGKVAKVPRQVAEPGRGASVNTPRHWGTFDDACAVLDNKLISGIGFVMNGLHESPKANEHVIAIDLDKCIGDDGKALPWAKDIVKRLGGYWELSPSGKGLRGFMLGRLPGPSFLDRNTGVEMYNGDSARYLTVTGRRIGGSTDDLVRVADSVLEEVYNQYRPSHTAEDGGKHDPLPPEWPAGDDVLAEYAAFLNEDLRAFLEHGTVAKQYPSRSELVFALAVALTGVGASAEQVLAALYDNPFVMQMALEHRQDDRERATEYLWHTVCNARRRAGVVTPDDFEELDAPSGAAETALADSAETAGPDEGEAELPLEPLDFNALEGASVPEQRWLVDQWVPMKELTLFYGDGGTGKSYCALQLMTCVALGIPWFGLDIREPGSALGIFCEESEEQLHMRQARINERYFTSFAELDGKVRAVPRVGQNNTMMNFESNGSGNVTELYARVWKACKLWRPKVVIIDTAADVFAGNENIRNEVRQFLNSLTALALEFDCAVILCAHPSVAGRKTGTGGSTGWENTARSRMWLERDEEGVGRTLRHGKANRGEQQKQGVRLIWHEGAFVAASEGNAAEFFASDDELADKLFLDLLKSYTAGGRTVSTARQGNYAPRVLTRHAVHCGQQAGASESRLEAAMDRLMTAGRLSEVPKPGGASRGVQLVEVEDER